MTILNLKLIEKDRTAVLEFRVRRIVNAGYAGRNSEAVRAHIAELEKEGVAPPASVPMIFPVLSHNVTTADCIEVAGSKTSGEVEFVLLMDGDEVYVGVGSDHTDRELETYSIPISKQVCPNVLSGTVWRLQEVEDRWDSLILRSWVRETSDGDDVLYQKDFLTAILPPRELIDVVKDKIPDGDLSGLLIYSGTIPVLTPGLFYGGYFRSELIDRQLNRELTCSYRVSKLDYLTV